MATRRLRGATRPFAVVFSAAMLMLGVSGALQTGSMGALPFGAAVASASPVSGASETAHSLASQVGSQSVVFLPGTGNPGEKGSVYAGNEHVVAYPAAPPVYGDYATSVVQGGERAADVVRTLPSGSTATLSGYSQGGHGARLAANQPNVTSDHEVKVVTTADPCTEETGILVRFPLAQAVTGVPCASIPADAHGLVINRADDPIPNFPTDLNGVTVANALVEYFYNHGNGYEPEDLAQTGVELRTVGNVTYVTIPANPTPALVRWARDHGMYVPSEVEADIARMVTRSDPGPEAPFQVVATQVAASPPVEPFVEEGANIGALPVAAPPAGNVQMAATMVQSVLPPEVAPMVDQMATQFQNSPLGGLLNGLPLG